MKQPLKVSHQLPDFKEVCEWAADWESAGLCEKNFVDIRSAMGYKGHMDIGKVLREIIAKEGRSFRQTSIDLKVDRSTLHRSLKKGNPEWKTIEKLLDYLDYEIRFKKKVRQVGVDRRQPRRDHARTRK